jgi:hypothetical protein
MVQIFNAASAIAALKLELEATDGNRLSQVRHRRWRGRPQESFSRLPLRRIVHIDQELHLAAGQSCDRYAVAIHDSVSRERRQSNSRCQDPDEIEWVCSGKRHPLVGFTLSALPSEQTDGFRQGILLAGETGYKSAAANFSACLEPAIDTQQIAPWRQARRFAPKQTPEHNTIPPQQRASHAALRDYGGCRSIAP